MLPLRYARRWQMAGIALLLFVLLATVMPAVWFWPDRGRIVSWMMHIDKWAHMLTFMFLALWFAGQFRPRSYWRIAIGLTVFGILIEACQRMVGYRTAEWFDIAADLVGIVAGLAIASAGVGGWSLRFEGWLMRTGAGNLD